MTDNGGKTIEFGRAAIKWEVGKSCPSFAFNVIAGAADIPVIPGPICPHQKLPFVRMPAPETLHVRLAALSSVL